MIKLVVLDVDGTSIDRDNHFYDNIKISKHFEITDE